MSQSAHRTLMLLQAVARQAQPVGLMELTQLTGLDKSTASRLLGELEQSEFVVRDPSTRRFSVGFQLRSLAASTLLNTPVIKVARPYLERLRDLTGETVFLHMRHRHERVCLDSVESNAEIRQVSAVGEIQPLYAVPSGKVMLAYLPEQEIAILLEQASQEGYDSRQIATQLADVREQMYLAVNEDKTPHVAILSLPVFDTLGANYSLTVAGPNLRWTSSRMQQFTPDIHSAGQALSHALGGKLCPAFAPA